MRVKELIEILGNYPQEMRVIISVHEESGYDNICAIGRTPIKEHDYKPQFYGEYKDCEENEKKETALAIF